MCLLGVSEGKKTATLNKINRVVTLGKIIVQIFQLYLGSAYTPTHLAKWNVENLNSLDKKKICQVKLKVMLK